MRLGALISTGKDSCYAAYLMKKEHDIVCVINIISKNPDSYMYHTPNVNLVELQANAMQIPLIKTETKGEKEKELKDLKQALEKAKNEYNIQGIATGALFSDYQRKRIENIADELKLKVFSPLWHMDQEKEMRSLLQDGFKIIFSSIAAEGLDKSWLGRVITNEDIDKLIELNKKTGINIAGEGGEFESLVLDCPLFSKQIKILEADIQMESDNTGKYVIKKAELTNK